MPFDIQRYYEDNKKYYGNASLGDVAKDVYKRGYADKYPDFDSWAKESGVEEKIKPTGRQTGIWDSLRDAAPVTTSFLQGAAEGLTTELPSMAGGALQFAGSHTPFKGIENTGKSLKDWAEQKRQELYGPETERTGLERIVYEGTKMLAPSIIPGGIIGTGARAIKGVSALQKAGKIAEATAAAKAANTIGAGGAAALFGLSQAQQTKDIAEERGVDPGLAPYMTGAIEAAGEFLGTKYLGKLFGLDEAVIAKNPKEFVKDLIKTLGVEIGTEIGQAGGESAVEKYSGIRPEANPVREAVDVIGPTAFMTILTGGLAGATRRMSSPDKEERDAAAYIENLKQGAMVSMAIHEGLKTGRYENMPFTSETAIDLIRKSREAGIFTDEDIERIHDRYPQLAEDVNDVILDSIKEKVTEVALNDKGQRLLPPGQGFTLRDADIGIPVGEPYGEVLHPVRKQGSDDIIDAEGNVILGLPDAPETKLLPPPGGPGVLIGGPYDPDGGVPKTPLLPPGQGFTIEGSTDTAEISNLQTRITSTENMLARSQNKDSNRYKQFSQRLEEDKKRLAELIGKENDDGTLQTETEIKNVAPTADLAAQDSIKGKEAAAGTARIETKIVEPAEASIDSTLPASPATSNATVGVKEAKSGEASQKQPWQMSGDEYYKSKYEKDPVSANKMAEPDYNNIEVTTGIKFKIGNDNVIRPVLKGGKESRLKFTTEEENSLRDAFEKQGFRTEKQYRIRKGKYQKMADIEDGMGFRIISKNHLPTTPEHYRLVKQAISEGQIASHPDYPELSKPEATPQPKTSPKPPGAGKLEATENETRQEKLSLTNIANAIRTPPPIVKDGFVRVYRGEFSDSNDPQRHDSGRFWTRSLNEASSYGDRLWYLDIPADQAGEPGDVLLANHELERTGAKLLDHGYYDIPEKIRDKVFGLLEDGKKAEAIALIKHEDSISRKVEAAESIKPLRMDGATRPERKKAHTLPGFRTLPQVTQDKFNTAFESKDIPKMQEYLDLANKNLRAEFENRTGVKLPNTVKGTDQAVSDYFSSKPVPKVEAKPATAKAGESLSSIIEKREKEIEVANAELGQINKELGRELSKIDSKIEVVKNKKAKRDDINERARNARLENSEKVREIINRYNEIIKNHPEEIARREESARLTAEMKGKEPYHDPFSAESITRVNKTQEEKPPESTKFHPEDAIKSAADSIETLRSQDVYRVLSETPTEYRYQVRAYIVKNHSGNQRILDAVRKAMDELEGKTATKVIPTTKTAEKNITTPKEQKKYLLEKIDEALKVAPNVPTGMNTYTAKQLRNFNKKDAIDKAAYEEAKQKLGTVTIEVPNDGTFTILNTKASLENFKKQTSKFPASVIKGAAEVKPPIPSSRATGKRVEIEDVTYYNEFKPRKQEVFGRTDGKNFYVNGYFTEGHYIVKTDKPSKINIEKPEDSPKASDIDRLFPEDKDLIPAKIVAEYYDGGESVGARAHVIGGEIEAITNAHQVDVILTKYPNASVFINEKGNKIVFKVGNEKVGLAMTFPEGIPSAEFIADHKADVQFQRTTTPTTGMQSADVQSIADKVTSSIQNPPKVNVVQSNENCPEEVQKIMEEQGITDAMGFTWNGEVYLVSDNIRNEQEALRTLAHELTHSGLGKFFQRQTKGKLMPIRVRYEALMDSIYRAHSKEIEKIANTTHTHLDMRTVNGRRQACEEWLCNQSYESQPKWYDKLVAIFHDLLRAAGINIKLSDAEVRVVLQDAFKEFGSEGVSFMTAWHGSPHDFDKFSKDKIGTGEGAQAYGSGLYFTSVRDVAEFYREKLSDGSRGGLGLAGVMPSATDKSLSYNAWSAAKQLTELLVSNSGEVKSFSSLNVVEQGRVLSMMHRLLENDEVLNTVVGFIPVDVVNVLGGKERSAKYLLHHPTMLIYLLPRNTDNLVPSSVPAMNVLAQAVTLGAAKVHTGLSRFDVRPSDFLSASGTLHDIPPKSISSKIPKPNEFVKGRLYQVELAPDEDEYLLWDKPLSEQSDKVRSILKEAGLYNDIEAAGSYFKVEPTASGKSFKVVSDAYEYGTYRTKEAADAKLADLQKAYRSTGQSFYYDMTHSKGSDKSASDYLHSLGIRGIKYLDGTSRGQGGYQVTWANGKIGSQKFQSKEQAQFLADSYIEDYGKAKIEWVDADDANHNYVIFDESDIEITAKFQRKGLKDTTEPANQESVTKDKGTANISAKTTPQAEAGTLEDLRKSWDERGIDNYAYEKNGAIFLSEIRISKDSRGKGIGTQAMQELVDYADRTGQKILLTPSTDFGATSVSRLEKFYKQFGFTSNRGSKKDYRYRETMIRRPLPNQSRPSDVGGQIKYSIRKQQDPPVSHDPKVLNLYIKDETDAIFQTIYNKLHPKKMTWLETMLKSPEWFTHPVVSRIVRIFMRDRSEIYHTIFNGLNAADDLEATEKTVSDAGQKLKNKGLSLAERIAGKESEEYRMLKEFVDYFDTSAKRNPDKTDEENLKDCENYMRKKGATDDVVRVWRLYRQSYDKALQLMTQQMRDLIDESKEKAAFMGKEFNMEELQQSLEFALAEMEKWKGYYAPRLREQGSWKVQAYKEHGPMSANREYYRAHAGSEYAAQRMARNLAREGWKITSIGEVERLPESVYQDVKSVAVEKLINNALDKMAQDGNAFLRLNEDVLRMVADEIKARGFRSSMIHRTEGAVIKGYIEDPIKRHLLYTNNISGGLSKAQVARMAMQELLGEKDLDGNQVGGIDPVKEPEAYKVATNYIQEQLRNMDATDRIIGLAKSIATFKFLGFNLRSLAVNMTALVTTAPPAIHQYALGGNGTMFGIMKELGNAGKDYGAYMAGKGKLTAEERSFLEDVHAKGWDDPQYTRDALGVIAKTHSRSWESVMNASMYLFGQSERFNRGTTILAAYRLARKQGLSIEDARERAKDACDKAHGVYGRATMPMWAQGANPAAKIGQMLYVYTKFGHNYLQMLYDMGFKKHNIKGAMFAFLSPLVVAGGTAIPFKGAIFGLAGAILSALGWDDDPEKWVWDQIREHLGSGAETVARHGLTGAAGVDISSSLSIGIGIPKNLMDLTGAVGGLATEIKEAGDSFRNREPGRALEHLLPTGLANPLKAMREREEGVSTRNRRRVWDEEGKPYEPGVGDTVAKTLGFRSSKQAVLSERTWEGHRQQTQIAERRNKIYEKYRAWLLGGRDREDYRKIVMEVREFNKFLSDHGLKGESRITSESLRDQARRMNRPSKKERAILSS